MESNVCYFALPLLWSSPSTQFTLQFGCESAISRESPLPVKRDYSHKTKGDPRHPCCIFPDSGKKVRIAKKSRYEQLCEEYETFSSNVTRQPVQVGLDITVLKITDVDSGGFRGHIGSVEVTLWLEVNYVDNRVAICQCQENNATNVRDRDFQLLGGIEGERWWRPDISVVDMDEREFIPTVSSDVGVYTTNMKAVQISGQTWIVWGAKPVIRVQCSMEKSFPHSINRCMVRFGSWLYNSTYMEFFVHSLKVNPEAEFDVVAQEQFWGDRFYKVFLLHEKDRVFYETRPKIESFEVDGFEIIITEIFPGEDEVNVLYAINWILYVILLIMVFMNGYPHVMYERSIVLQTMVHFTEECLSKIPTGLWGFNDMDSPYWYAVKNAIVHILVVVVTVIYIVRGRADGQVSFFEQCSLQFFVGFCILVSSLYASGQFRAELSQGRNEIPGGCHNFLNQKDGDGLH